LEKSSNSSAVKSCEGATANISRRGQRSVSKDRLMITYVCGRVAPVSRRVSATDEHNRATIGESGPGFVAPICRRESRQSAATETSSSGRIKLTRKRRVAA